jgi:hypothetical protein
MADQETWAQRVSEWKSSGLTSIAYCRGKPFTAGGLRHWAHRLGRSRRQGTGSVRVARVLRVSELRSSSSKREPWPTGVALAEALVVEIGAARVAVRPGFDRAALAAVLEVLAAAPGSTR